MSKSPILLVQRAPQPTQAISRETKGKMAQNRLEHLGHAIVGLCMMSFSTSLVHVYTSSKFWNHDGPRPQNEAGLLVATTATFAMVIPVIWATGFWFWIEHLTYVSVIQRNSSLIGGIGAANVGLVWACLWKPSATFQIYLAYTLWPAYLGLIVGTSVTSASHDGMR